jgi:uncharacterized protein DUF6879
MRQLGLPDSRKAFDTLFTSAKHTMFKAEVLQDYAAVDDCPSLRAWLAGDPERSRTLGEVDENIIAYRNRCLASPATITRVHIVKKPYTDYFRWEKVICYQDSLLRYQAESIFLVDAEELADVVLPVGDFWIFDDQHVLQWEYEHGDGKTAGSRLWSENLGDNIDYFRQLGAVLLRHAEPVPLNQQV